MLKINMKDGSVLLLAPRMHTMYPPCSDGPAFCVAHFDDGLPEYVGMDEVESVCHFADSTKLRANGNGSTLS